MYGSSYATLLAFAAGTAATSVSTTPHDSYSSSIGVLGCKIDTNRVAYWPGSVDCNNLCVKLTYGDRSVNLLRVDQSGGAYDISYDAWAYLQTGKSATVDAITGGGVDMEYEEVDASECADLIQTDGSKLPLSASNSMNFLSSCLAEPDSWVAQNHVLYNICDSVCTLGFDETCTLDLSVSNQPSCPHTLGLTTTLAGAAVTNIEYESGKAVVAGSGVAASGYSYAEAGADSTEAEVTTSAAQVASTPTTSVDAAVFQELTSSSTSVEEYATAPASTTTTAAAAATTSTYVPIYTTSSSSSTSTSISISSSAETSTVAQTSSYVPVYSTSTSTSISSTAPASTVAQTSSESIASSFATTVVSSVQSSAASSSAAASFPATTLVSSTQSYAASNTAASSIAASSSVAISSSAAQSSVKASSTFAVATKSSAQSSASATSSNSAATSSAAVTSGNSKIGAPISALLSSAAIYLLVSLL
ncbi:hypothetical protein LQW54_008116 [Pestalotiopsis sp. IQ-011]